MEKTVQDVIDEKKETIIKKRAEIAERKKQALIEKTGLFRKEYSKDSKAYNDEYPYAEFSEDSNRYYKKVSVPITDEEYEQLRDLDEQMREIDLEIKEFNAKIDVSTSEGQSGYEIVLIIIAVLVFISGFITGCAWMYMGRGGYGVLIWIGSFASGFPFLAFAKMISLLNSIKRDTKK